MDISSATARVAPDLLKALAILSDTTVRRSSVDREDLKSHRKSEKGPHFSNLFQWFIRNELKGNASKCHLLISSGENVHVNVGASQIKNRDWERLLEIDIDCKFNFENHINQICSKARAEIKAPARIALFLNKRKRKLLIMHFSNLSLIITHYHGCFIAVY